MKGSLDKLKLLKCKAIFVTLVSFRKGHRFKFNNILRYNVIL